MENTGGSSDATLVEATFAIFEFMLTVIPGDNAEFLSAFDRLRLPAAGASSTLSMREVNAFIKRWKTDDEVIHATVKARQQEPSSPKTAAPPVRHSAKGHIPEAIPEGACYDPAAEITINAPSQPAAEITINAPSQPAPKAKPAASRPLLCGGHGGAAKRSRQMPPQPKPAPKPEQESAKSLDPGNSKQGGESSWKQGSGSSLLSPSTPARSLLQQMKNSWNGLGLHKKKKPELKKGKSMDDFKDVKVLDDIQTLQPAKPNFKTAKSMDDVKAAMEKPRLKASKTNEDLKSAQGKPKLKQAFSMDDVKAALEKPKLKELSEKQSRSSQHGTPIAPETIDEDTEAGSYPMTPMGPIPEINLVSPVAPPKKESLHLGGAMLLNSTSPGASPTSSWDANNSFTPLGSSQLPQLSPVTSHEAGQIQITGVSSSHEAAQIQITGVSQLPQLSPTSSAETGQFQPVVAVASSQQRPGVGRSRLSKLGNDGVTGERRPSASPNTLMLPDWRHQSPGQDMMTKTSSSRSIFGKSSMSMVDLMSKLDTEVLVANDELMPEQTFTRAPTVQRKSLGRKSFGLKAAEVANEHIINRLESMPGDVARKSVGNAITPDITKIPVLLFEWTEESIWIPLGLYLKMTGIVPASSRSGVTWALSNVYSNILGLMQVLAACYHLMILVLQVTRLGSPKQAYVRGIASVMLPLATAYLWWHTKHFFTSALFVTFLEYAERKEFTDHWALLSRGIVSLCLFFTMIAVSMRIIGGPLSAPVDVVSLLDMNAGLFSFVEGLVTACDSIVLSMVMASTCVLLVCCKFAHVAAFSFSQEVIDTMEIHKVCALWSVFIVLTRCLSIAMAKHFVLQVSLSVYILITILLLGIVGDTPILLPVGLVPVVLIGGASLKYAADVKENSRHAISLVNMIDFAGTEGEKIDHDKMACVSYLQASDIGFRVLNQPVAMHTFIQSGYVFIAAIIAMATGALGV